MENVIYKTKTLLVCMQQQMMFPNSVSSISEVAFSSRSAELKILQNS